MAFPHLSLSPDVLALEADSLGQQFGQRKDKGNDVLGHDRAVHVASIGEDDVTGDQLGNEQRMHSSGGRVNPAKLAGGGELLGAQRPGDEDFSIGQVTLGVLVTVELGNFKIGKILTKALGEPGWRTPKFEAVLEKNKKL